MRNLHQKQNQARQETINMDGHSGVLQGRTRLVLQGLWLLIVLFEVAILISNIQAVIATVNTVCPDNTGASCISLQLKTAQLSALSHYGLKLSSYALYALICDLILTILLLSIGIVIFWHKSNERMELFVSLLLITFACFGIDDVNLVIKPPFPFAILAFLIFVCQWPGLGILFYTFPDGRFVPRWSWLLSFLFVIQLVFYLLPSPYQIGNWPPLL